MAGQNNQLSRYGAIARELPFSFGNVYFVLDPAQSYLGDLLNTYPVDGDGQVRVFTDVEEAYDACVSGRNDYIILDGNSTHDLSAPLTVSKNRVNFVGLGELRQVQQGAKIQCATTGTDAFVVKNTGVRNTFKNIKFIQSSTEVTALYSYVEGGEGTLMEYCSATFGVASNLDLTTANELLFGGDSCHYKHCQFGQDTLLTSAARSIMVIDQTNGFEAKSNVFEDCTWLGSSSDAGLQAISMAAAGDILFTNHFIRPSFIASLDSAGGIACTKAVSTANGTTKGTIYLSYPMVHGFDDVGINGTNNDNLFVFSHVPSAANITSAKPTTS